MNLTAAQFVILQQDILVTNIAALQAFVDAIDDVSIATWYNALAGPDFWVWKTALAQNECVGVTSQDGTNWSWPLYINRSQGERDGWREMFADTGSIDPSRLNVRQGLADIFSGAGGAPQRTHLLAIARRQATRAEKLFATGTGTAASPASMAVGAQSELSYLDVAHALRGIVF